MNQSDEDTAGVFRALADPTRRQIVDRFTISAPSISRHLGLLKGAGLVRERRAANRIYYSLVEERLALCVGGFLSAVCPEQVVLRRKRGRNGAKR
jgi:DNA-binding transcriptional ArsR family regulator